MFVRGNTNRKKKEREKACVIIQRENIPYTAFSMIIRLCDSMIPKKAAALKF